MLAEAEEEVFDPDESDELDEPDEVVEDEVLLLSLLPLSDELSLLGLLSEFPLLSDGDVEFFTSVFSPLFSGLALGSLSLSE